MIECGGRRILIDCGLYQGGREIEEENAEDFGFDASNVDTLLLTHAHLDHCGRIPLLTKRGFEGEIVTTGASRELARLVLLDSAHLQEEEARYQSRHKARRGRQHDTKPLYSITDVLNSTDRFGRRARYNEPLELAPGIRATFFDAGHILGSASILLELEENGVRRSVLFSGDIGNSGRQLLRDPATPKHADVVVMETTYGDRAHKALEPSVDELYEAINTTFKRGGNVIIPTFALERAQELLYYLREGVAQDRLPGSLQVFLDSPMAISATEIYERHPDCFEPHVAALFRGGNDPFDLPGLHFTRETAESIALNRVTSGAVILAGSGMCTGGRVRHHLKQNLWRHESSIVFVGFAANGTLARQIIDGAKEVRIFGETFPVRAAVHTINGFSAHADQAELLEWHGRLDGPEKTYLVHGEERAMTRFAEKLALSNVILPRLGESFAL
jgi:metallo-beta-lactamase family protein